MGLRQRLFALTYDRQMAGAERAGLLALRSTLLADAEGHVLEVGGGTGMHLSLYGGAVDALTVTEPDPSMLRRLQRRADALERPVTVLRAPAEDLPFEDDTFDVVVSALVLCGVSDQPRAVRELRRVLKPGGRLLFLEHVRAGADDERLARHQDRWNWFSRAVAGCECNRPTLDTIRRGGFVVDRVDHTAFPKGPAFVRPLIVGRATSPARDLAARS